MKIIHVPFCFRPDPIGGTEVYVEALARAQMQRGADAVIAAPAHQSARYTDRGLSVRRFAVSAGSDIDTLYGKGDLLASEEFVHVVDEERPDIVHLHSFTSAVSACLAGSVRRRGVPLVFTYHTPTVSCQRGTLLRWGNVVCDGRLDVRRCAACTLHAHGVDRRSALLAGVIPARVGRVVGGLGARGGAWTALRMTSLLESQHAAFRSFVDTMDRIVVLCHWTRDLLVRNGIQGEKIVFSPHGMNGSPPANGIRTVHESVLRVAFLGRLHPTKGLDILVRAVTSLPGAPLVLDVFGIGDGADNVDYLRSLKALATSDRRIAFHAPVPPDQVVTLLRTYDVLAVPSRWLETGPLVALEAFAAGIPVVGSNLGGIAELVEDGVNGLLVEPESVESMTSALLKLVRQPELLARLRAGVLPPRRMEAVADDMQAIYAELLA